MLTDSPARTRILVGVGGGIAAYKACELIRRLRDGDRADVVVAPTENALKFVGAATLEALSGHPVSTSVFSDIPRVAHVATGQHSDLVVVAPATADLLARMAAGRADDLLTASLLVTRAPVLVAPAMHTEMWTHPATVANVATLRARGVTILDPAVGRLTGADSGAGRLPEPEHIALLAELLLLDAAALPYDLSGRQVLVTAGGTREALDPVRFLGNRSSGLQGFAVALVAAARGADVTLVAANTTLAHPPGVTVVPVTSAAELAEATRAGALHADAIVMAAAVADFRPVQQASSKIKKTASTGPVPIELTENPDILAGLVRDRSQAGRPVIVGFAAETGDDEHSVLDYGRAKLRRKGCDLLVVNDVSRGAVFGESHTQATILTDDGRELPIPHGPKTVTASAICRHIADRLR